MRGTQAFIAACAVSGAALLTGCGGLTGYSGPSTWALQSPSGDLTTAKAAPDNSRSAVPASSTWNLKRTTPGDPNVDAASWPDARTALTHQQLTNLFPKASVGGSADCSKLMMAGEVRTGKDSRCTWSITLQGSGSTVSTVTVSLKGFGADAPMTTRWTADERTQIAGKLGSDTFFTEGTFGAKGSYFLSNMHASVLLSNGNNAAWVDLDFVGFYQLYGNNSDNTVLGLRTQVFPVLVQHLVGLLPRSARGTPASEAATAS